MTEFPDGSDSPPLVSRRDLLRLLGANAAMAGAAGCSRGAPEYVVPYVKQPPGVTPSRPTLYATTISLGGYGTGMLVESHEGRPTKAEGNTAHPSSLGALGPFEQASVLSLYDPARARELRRDGAPSTFRALLADVMAAATGDRRIHVLLEPTSSPHVIPLVEQLRRKGFVVHFDTPLDRRAAWAGAKLAFGRALEARWDVSRADVILALDADFLAAAGSPMAWARGWADRRRLRGPASTMNRLYVVEPRLTTTGMSADQRLRVQARAVRGVAASILAEVIALGQGSAPDEIGRAARARPAGPHADWARAVARDLKTHAGGSLVVAGDGQPPLVHGVAHAINDLLGNAGRTVTYAEPPVYEAGGESHGLDELLRAMDSGEVGALVILGGDPAYTASADRGFARRLRAIAATAYVGLYANETSSACRWFLPGAHFLESWSDSRAFDGTASIAQPLMRPLAEGWTPAQVLAALGGAPEATARELVERHWRAQGANGDDTLWERALVRGFVEGSAAPPVTAAMDWAAIGRELAAASSACAELEIVYFADAKVHDGRFANNAWLQELGDPVTKLAWDNAALVAPATAARLQIATEDVVELRVRDRTLRAPALVLPGMADDVVALALGYGQTAQDLVSAGVGANAYALRDSRSPWFDDVSLRKTGETWRLSLTQEHWSMEDRPVVLSRTLEQYRADPNFAKAYSETRPSLYGLMPDAVHQWGMTIDLGVCTGCSACVIACMAENNIPVVGKAGVRLGREMQWIRIDRYLADDPEKPVAALQPMLCQHCEKAPCEYVCPVNATVHSHDGLNEMVYNRCVGTRFCSNNCPYKVRRFNFFNYNADKPDSLALAMNPDVTVRARGVMEKCSYCVQRIREVEIRARREQRAIRDLEVQTACQQTCPTGAIVFGDIADPATHVSEVRRDGRLYAVLDHLGTIPRTRYLARIFNPNAEIARP